MELLGIEPAEICPKAALAAFGLTGCQNYLHILR